MAVGGGVGWGGIEEEDGLEMGVNVEVKVRVGERVRGLCTRKEFKESQCLSLSCLEMGGRDI